MKYSGNITRAALIAATLLSLPAGTVSADDIQSAPKKAAKADATFSNAISDKDLANDRGEGTTTLFANSTQIGNSSDNVVVGGFTGNNSVDNGALNGASGIVSVVQNSGNNVVVQSSTIVNMTLNNN